MRTALYEPLLSRSLLIGAGGLIIFAITIAGVTRATHQNHVALPPSAPVATRDLSFTDRADGGIVITDARSGALVSIVAPQTGGFLRGIMRGLVRGHRREDKAPHTAFRLTQWTDGRLSIEDPATHESFELEAFGATNEKVFAQLLEAPGAK